MDTELMLDVGQAQELKLAFRRHGWTNAEIKKLSEGDFLAQVLMVVRGKAVITTVKKEKKTVMIALPATLDCTKPFDPATFIGQDWNVWKGPIDGDGLSGEEEVDPCSLILTSLDPAKLLLETCLRPIGAMPAHAGGEEKEGTITGEEKLKRLKENPNLIRLGGNVFLALWEDYQQNKENSVLEWLYRTKNITYLDFFGMILRSPGGSRGVLCLYRDGDGQWDWRHGWLDDDWSARRFSAVAQVL